ncbi:MAG: hypothetical protein HUU15_03235 [Candidatus Brocadiae bacterium]|nr:hypothetical protein [Candidatus Brocadiia bacterium]
MNPIPAIALLLGTALAAGAQSPAGDLTPATRTRFRDLILPAPAEDAWRGIPWRTTYWEAVTEGQRTERPIFLWTMNGHPLACT